MGKNEECVACHSQNNADNKQFISKTSDEKQSNTDNETINEISQPKETASSDKVMVKKRDEARKDINENQDSKQLENNNNSSNQGNSKTDKVALISRLEIEIAELKKNLDPNNTEQKAILAQKEAQLAGLKDKQNKNQSVKSSNIKENNLTSTLLPIGIIATVLLVVSATI